MPSNIYVVSSSVWVGLEIPIGIKLNPHQTSVAWPDFGSFFEIATENTVRYSWYYIPNVTEEEPMDQEPGDDENLSSEEETCYRNYRTYSGDSS